MKIGLTYDLKDDYRALGMSELRNAVLCLVDESTCGSVQLFEDYVFYYGADQQGCDLERVEGSIDEVRIACERNRRCVAFITHGGFTQSLLQAIFAISAAGSDFAGDRHVWLKSNNGSITRIDVTDELLRLTYLNYIDYMPRELLT